MKHQGSPRTELSRRALIVAGVLSLSLSVAPVHANQSGVAIPPVPTFDEQDPVAYGTAIANHAERYDSGWVDQYSKGKMTLFDARGDSVEREVVQAVLEGKQGDKSLVRFMTPADIRGVAALIHEHPGATDDSWLYLPASRRVRRISGANRTSSFQGTEFTYEDLTNLSAVRYSWRFLKVDSVASQPVYLVEAVPRYKDTGYSKLIAAVHRTHFRGERIEYFDKAGRKLKTLTTSNWKHIHGRFWRAQRQEMTNHQTGKRTLIESTDLRLNMSLYPSSDGSKRANLSEALFTRRALEGG